MKGMAWLGVILLLVGVVVLAYPVIRFTRTEKVVELGPLEVTKETKERVPMPPLLGGAAALAGVVLLVAGSRAK